jgi:hypothetical protein
MNRALLVAGIIALASTMSTGLQVSPSASVYRSQYRDLRTKASGLLERSRAPRADKLALQQEGFAMLKLVYRLQEEAGKDNLESLKKNQASDKSLLLVGRACDALAFMLAAIDNYLDTGDLAFVQLARQAIVLMDTTETFF